MKQSKKILLKISFALYGHILYHHWVGTLFSYNI